MWDYLRSRVLGLGFGLNLGFFLHLLKQKFPADFEAEPGYNDEQHQMCHSSTARSTAREAELFRSLEALLKASAWSRPMFRLQVRQFTSFLHSQLKRVFWHDVAGAH